MMAATVSVNGRITSGADAVVPVFDHGFLYGEGIYETLAPIVDARFCSTGTCGVCATPPG